MGRDDSHSRQREKERRASLMMVCLRMVCKKDRAGCITTIKITIRAKPKTTKDRVEVSSKKPLLALSSIACGKMTKSRASALFSMQTGISSRVNSLMTR
jgi:hypothetical protein